LKAKTLKKFVAKYNTNTIFYLGVKQRVYSILYRRSSFIHIPSNQMHPFLLHLFIITLNVHKALRLNSICLNIALLTKEEVWRM